MSNGERHVTIRFDAPVVSASFHPKNRYAVSVLSHPCRVLKRLGCSKLLLVTLQTQQTFLVDLRKATRSRTELVDNSQAQDATTNQKR